MSDHVSVVHLTG